MFRPIAIATAVAGTLDILFAMILTVAYGRQIDGMLRYVGSGPFPAATEMGMAGAILGLAVHFALMAVMAAVLMVYLRANPQLFQRPLLTGLVYGLITYAVMNLVVVPLPPKPMSIAKQLFAHIVLVGIPMALVARKYLRPRRFA